MTDLSHNRKGAFYLYFGGMDWGVHLPHLGRDVDRDSLTKFVQTAEELGVHSGWTSDHVWPTSLTPSTRTAATARWRACGSTGLTR